MKDIEKNIVINSNTSEIPHESKLSIGQWYWVQEDGEQWLGCVTQLGSNFVKLEGIKRRQSQYVTRVHYDDVEKILQYEPNGESVIETNIANASRQIAVLTGKIKELMSDLGIRDEVLGIEGPVVEDTTNAIVAISNGDGIKNYKKDLVKAKEKTLPNLLEEIKKQSEELSAWTSARVVPIEAAIKPLNSIIDSVNTRIFNVELYAGLVEQLIKCKDGKPAAREEKLRVMQRKLFMDEECLLAYSSGGMEFDNIEEFDKWLSKPVNRDRILPFPRTLVAMQVRRNKKERDWGGKLLNLFINLQIEESDKYTFLYIRNGDQVWRLSCELEFDDLIFPSAATISASEVKMVKMFCDRVDSVMGKNEYDVLVSKLENDTKLAKKWKKEHPNESWVNNPYERYSSFRPSDWKPFDKSNVYYDECSKYMEDIFAKYNRIALLIQGIFDRSEALLPHKNVKTWTEEGFAEAIELVQDGTNVLYENEKPDFEAYRAKLNSTLASGCVTVGQQEYWLKQEAEKENDRLRRDWRNKTDYRHEKFQPYGDPGPGLLAKVEVWNAKQKKATYRWKREARSYNGEPVSRRVIVPDNEILNVSAYNTGDYKQFFQDPRTRSEYLIWAPLLLAAEDFKAGKLKAGGEDNGISG